jgi:hypothetical protein
MGSCYMRPQLLLQKLQLQLSLTSPMDLDTCCADLHEQAVLIPLACDGD